MQFRVVIPEHIKSGQYIKVHCPPDGKGSKGREAELRVPKGLKPGDSFVFDISDKDNSLTIANDVELLNNQIAASNNNGGSGGGAQNNNHAANNNNNNGGNFLDREVLHLKDFLVALGIGLIIGISIVVGFVMGVLSATSGVQMAYNNAGGTNGGGMLSNAGLYQLQYIKDGQQQQQQMEGLINLQPEQPQSQHPEL